MSRLPGARPALGSLGIAVVRYLAWLNSSKVEGRLAQVRWWEYLSGVDLPE